MNTHKHKRYPPRKSYYKDDLEIMDVQTNTSCVGESTKFCPLKIIFMSNDETCTVIKFSVKKKVHKENQNVLIILKLYAKPLYA